ncbi:m7GpppN-mRNA hydrolase NUDT17 isoform X2 [Ascaphus truei]|uniref:m7GpppN-mRNA hydrolase NUDT17 isoform X2 n=1 Tax=Ascaphus truei TaxID=8439 RepID=UPI003F5A2424
MEPTKRVLVYLSKENSLLQCAKFVQSVAGHFSCHQEDKVFVNCGLEQNRFVLSDRQFSGSSRVLLQRAAFCPIKNLSPDQAASLPEEIRTRGVDVGVVVLLQSVNKKVLLTRRSKNLSLFPNVWVPPGGHIEMGEQSAFPPLLSCGLTRRHHIVTFLLVLSSETHLQLQKRLCPDEKEVSACVWLESQIVEHIVAAEDGAQDSGKSLGDLPATVGITEASCGALIQKDLDVTKFLNSAPKDGEDVERISTGTKYALRLWLDTLSQQNL